MRKVSCIAAFVLGLGNPGRYVEESIAAYRFKLAARFNCTIKELGERLDHGEFLAWLAWDNAVTAIANDRQKHNG